MIQRYTISELLTGKLLQPALLEGTRAGPLSPGATQVYEGLFYQGIGGLPLTLVRLISYYCLTFVF